MGDFLAEIRERSAARYLEQVERGEHDAECEYDARGFHLCHCSKRRREAAGLTEVPADDLYFPAPRCPHCNQELDCEDGWVCFTCHLSWDHEGTAESASFTDDYGKDLAGDLERWRATNVPALPKRGGSG